MKKHFSRTSLSQLPSRERANLINTISGYKSANLIGTKSKEGKSNVSLFNSVVHLGSNPALLGFILRPLTVDRHTYENIRTTSFFTVNAVTEAIYKSAHGTSAKYEKGVSEFSKTGLSELYHPEFSAPFVEQSPIHIGCSYTNEYKIEENGCILIVGAIQEIYLQESLLLKDHWAKLDESELVSIVGLDGYAKPTIIDRLAYAKPDEPVKSIWHGPQKS